MNPEQLLDLKLAELMVEVEAEALVRATRLAYRVTMYEWRKS